MHHPSIESLTCAREMKIINNILACYIINWLLFLFHGNVFFSDAMVRDQ